MKRFTGIFQALMALVLAFGVIGIIGNPPKTVSANNTPQTLPFSQNWANANLITTNDDWSGVPGIVGYLGDYAPSTAPINIDPQTLLADYSGTTVDVIEGQSDVAITAGGVAEFEGIADRVVALQGSGSADAPHLLFYLNTTGYQNIVISYDVRDIDSTGDNAKQQVAAHYRVGNEGNFTNLPAGYIEDATDGPSKIKTTPISLTLPSDANNQPLVLFRVMTTNATGSDEWVGIDNISVTGTPVEEDLAPTVSSTMPANNGTITKSENISITFSEPVNVAEGWYEISCATSGLHTADVADTDPTYTLDPINNFEVGESCTVTIYADKVNDKDLDDAVADYMVSNYTFTFNVIGGCGDPFIQVYELQGTGSATPYVNQIVTTEGIVVADLQNVGNKRAFYIHAPVWDDDETTSDGIMVYTGTNPRAVTVGDRIRITAKIVEFSTVTELTPTATDPITVCSSGNAVVAKEVTLPWASADLEPIEGMLVKFTQDLYVNDYYQFDQYGQVTLGSSRHFQPTSYMEPGPDAYNAANALKLDEISLDDGQTAQNPDYLPHIASGRYTQGTVGPVHIFRGGDSVSNLHAIVDYVSGWRFVRVGEATFNQNNPRTIAPSLVPGEIRVSSINTLNFFKTLNTFPTQNICGPNSDMGCRGANSEEEQTRQIAKTAAAVVGMDADVIGLLELENDRLAMLNDWGADYAIRMIVDKMNDLTTPGLYNHVPTGVIGSDAIKVGIVYRTTNVEPLLDEFGKVKFSLLTSAVDPNFDDSLHRPALAVSFRDKHTDGIFTLAINHLKSKGCGSASGSDADQQDGQSCWNNARTKGANALVKWLETDPNGSGSNLFLIMGDLNSYAKEDPINAIIAGPDGVLDTADDYLDMAARFHVLHEEPGLINYGYVYGAMAGSLDYALANKPLANYVLDAKEWHINADEADVIDYNLQWSATGFKPADQANLYQSDPYRSSDHDPILVSLLLNHSPEAVDDEYYVATNDVLTVEAPGVMANDFDPNIYEAQTVALVPESGPWNGTLTLNVDGSFVYTPNPDFVGEDSFQYVFSSLPTIQAVNTDTATVTIHVGSPLVVSEADLMLASDMSGPYLKQTGSLPLAYLIEIDPSHVWYYLDVDNVVSNRPLADGMYPFEMGGQVIFYLKVEGTDYTLIDGYLYHSTGVESPLRIDGTFTPGTYTYTGQVKDEIGWPADVSITLIVTNLNQAPVANLDYYTVKAYESLVVPPSGVMENDEDELKPLLMAELTYNVENGTLVFNPDGSFTYTPTPGFVGLDNFAYRVFDGKSWSDPTAVVITVTAAEFFIYLPLVLR